MNTLLRVVGLDQDSLREARIDDFRKQMLAAETVGERLQAWRCMCREIHNRSPQQVARMEKERRLL